MANYEEIEASVVHRTGRPTARDYDEAIEALTDARTQLEPNGNGCHVCHDSGHQAFECHHNPLIRARQSVAMEQSWRCFHCGERFFNEADAREHFGPDETTPAACEAASGLTPEGAQR